MGSPRPPLRVVRGALRGKYWVISRPRCEEVEEREELPGVHGVVPSRVVQITVAREILV